MNSFVEFLAEYRDHFESVKAETAKELRQNAPNFNIFRALDMQDKIYGNLRSETAHSAFLAALLDPSENHAQGTLFIDSFLKMCQDKKVFPDHVFSLERLTLGDEVDWQIATEYAFPDAGKDGRLDMVIYSYSLGRFYVVENKISEEVKPADVKRQLLRYSQLLARQRTQFSAKALILITPNGMNISSPKHISLSYRMDIKRWLEQSLEDVQAATVHDAIKRYIEILDPKLETVQRDEGLEQLLEDNKQYVDLVRRFWDGLQDNLDKRIRQSQFRDRWELVPVYLDQKNPLHDYAQCHIQPKREEGQSQVPFLRVGIEQGTLKHDYPLYYGFHWSRPEMPEMLEIVSPPAEISEWGVTDEELGWWLRKQQTDYKIGSELFAQKMTDRPTEFINDMAGCVWSLFKKHYEWLEKANNELSRRYGGS